MFKNNRKKLYEAMGDDSMLVLYSGAPPRKLGDQFYEHFPDRNFFYLTGLTDKNLVLAYIKSKLVTREVLYTLPPDPYLQMAEGTVFDPEQAKAVSGMAAVDTVEKLDRMLSNAFGVCNVGTLYLDLGTFDMGDTLTPGQKLAGQVRRKTDDKVAICDVADLIGRQRMIKAPWEREQIRQAATLTNEAIAAMMKAVRPGMNERELDALFRYTVRRHGGEEGFQVIASGANALSPHYRSNNAPIADNTLVLTDVGAIWNNYYADVTRTFPVNGRFTPRQRQLYDIVLNAQLRAIEAIRPGVKVSKIDALVTGELARSCLDIGLISREEEIGKYWFGGMGHFLGLECHDLLRHFVNEDVTLEAGMVVTVEPALYVGEESIGIRIEDDIIVTDTGCEVLSAGLAKTVDEIEALMGERV